MLVQRFPRKGVGRHNNAECTNVAVVIREFGTARARLYAGEQSYEKRCGRTQGRKSSVGVRRGVRGVCDVPRERG